MLWSFNSTAHLYFVVASDAVGARSRKKRDTRLRNICDELADLAFFERVGVGAACVFAMVSIRTATVDDLVAMQGALRLSCLCC